MSIYATCETFQLPADGGCALGDDEWIEIMVQGVPAHIGHPSLYHDGDPYGDFLPPPTEHDDGPPLRAAVIVTEYHRKDRQRYVDPIATLTGAEYETIPFRDLLARCSAWLAAHYAPADYGWRETEPGIWDRIGRVRRINGMHPLAWRLASDHALTEEAGR